MMEIDGLIFFKYQDLFTSVSLRGFWIENSIFQYGIAINAQILYGAKTLKYMYFIVL